MKPKDYTPKTAKELVSHYDHLNFSLCQPALTWLNHQINVTAIELNEIYTAMVTNAIPELSQPIGLVDSILLNCVPISQEDYTEDFTKLLAAGWEVSSVQPPVTPTSPTSQIFTHQKFDFRIFILLNGDLFPIW